MRLEEFDYYLPEELIAQEPPHHRTDSRLLVLNKNTGKIEHKRFKNLLDYINKGDSLVLNDTKVIPARLFGKREDTGGKMEFVLLKQIDKIRWEVLVNPGRRAKLGSFFIFGENDLKAKIIDYTEYGGRVVEFYLNGIFEEVLGKIGQMPTPPYIKTKLKDKDRYQTVYAKKSGSAAAPTAGLHFNKRLLDKIKKKGVNIVFLTLHVGLGTFRPVKVEKIENHKMHSEYYEISASAADIINGTKETGHKVFAVGTTTTRVLETVANKEGYVKAQNGWSDIFIYPGYEFKIIDGLVTNFHLPKSTLLMLVSAFAGKEKIFKAYEEAVKKQYKFFSFGDAMLIL